LIFNPLLVNFVKREKEEEKEGDRKRNISWNLDQYD